MPTNTFQDRMIALFQIGHVAEDRRRDRIIQARLIGLGHGSVCGRCCGSGHYSYNAMDGSRCYGCSGSGYKAQNITKALVAAVEADIASGAYAQYMTDLKAREAANKACKDATKRVMDAWQASGVSQAYDWRKVSSGGADKFVADTFNNPMCQAFEGVQKLSNEIDSLTWKIQNKVKDAAEKASAETARHAKTLELAEATTKALELIQERATALQTYLSTEMVTA